MKLPLTINVKGRHYRVKRLPKATSQRGDFLGDCCFEQKLIRVATHNGPDEAASTLLHEVLHAMLHEYGVELDDDAEEELVLKLEDALFQVLRDNAGALEYIIRQP
jgi:hypothetical protein